MNVGAALADQNVARQDELAVRPLGAQALGLGVAAVLGGAAALLVQKKKRKRAVHGPKEKKK